jgi:hypothetical protein
MIVAANIVIYIRVLVEHVLKPTYVVRDSEIGKALKALGSRDPCREAYVRAVLLKSLPVRRAHHKTAYINLSL